MAAPLSLRSALAALGLGFGLGLARWRWQFAQWLRGVGLPGQVALVLLLATGVGWLLELRPAGQRVEQLLADQEALRLRPSAPMAAVSPGPEEQLAAFERRFADARALPAAAAQVLGLAKRYGVELKSGSFELQSAAEQPLARYVMDLPLKADYRTLRRFLDAVMRDQPNLALQTLTFAQPEPPAVGIDARVRLVLFIAKTP